MTTNINSEKRKAIILGGTSPHVKLIEKLKERGFYTILVDCLDNSPGIAVADEYVCESTLDLEKVFQVAKEKEAELVISTCIDQANSTCCYVAEQLGLPKPYDYQTSLNVTNKALMKKIMVENNIPTSWYTVIENIEDINFDKITYPAVVKPVDCNSSKGVHSVDTDEEVRQYIEEALRLSRTQTAIIEGFNEGEEIQVDCFATADSAKVIMTRQKQRIVSENGMVLQSFGSIIPAPVSSKVAVQIDGIAEKIAKAFGLKNTPFFYQAIVVKDEVKVLEFAPRIGGGLSYYLIKMVTGFDVVDAAIDSFLQKNVNVSVQENKKVYSTNLLYMHPGSFSHIEGMEILKNENVIKESFCMKKKGTYIDENMCSSNRVGAFVVEAENYDMLLQKQKEAFEKIKIYDEDGNELLNRDAYKK